MVTEAIVEVLPLASTAIALIVVVSRTIIGVVYTLLFAVGVVPSMV